ncbi:DUF6153 family protein [Streptomyces sp. NPDC096080]|uniref:DUF6153 family protein n=1 Tax=Streptomyces sp. NPDC096080 TaxID=3156693 RepID=UPI00332038E1
MTARTQPTPAMPPAVRWRWALVLALLAGLFAMHALAPGGGGAHPTSTAVPSHTAMSAAAHGGCADAGQRDGGHVRHADQMCASGAVGGGPALPALTADPSTGVAPAGDMRGCPAAAPDGARAPPSLAALQLLRI